MQLSIVNSNFRKRYMLELASFVPSMDDTSLLVLSSIIQRYSTKNCKLRPMAVLHSQRSTWSYLVAFALILSSFTSNCLLLNSAERISPSDRIGPYFTREPAYSVTFSNNTGVVIYCTASGNQTPKVNWETKNDQLITENKGFRHVRHDNALVFQPFAAEDYRPDLHSNVYRCSASNSVGVIKSRYVHVRAAVEQRFVVEVYDEFVTAGNSAVLRCHIPAFVRDLLDIVAWVEGSSNYILPDHHPSAESKYRILTTGEIYIQNVEPKDALKTFRCQVKHRLTNEKILSSTSGRIFVSELYTSQPPRIVDTKSTIVVDQGKSIEIGCLAHGHPLPTYTWYRNSEPLSERMWETSIHLMQNYHMPHIQIMPNSIQIDKVSTLDAGIYRCIVNNSLGSEIAETQLIVQSPLSVQIGHPLVRADLGHSLTLNCTVGGGPVKAIEWLHNGRPLSAISSGVSALRIRLLSREVLHIAKVTRADKGMYQCVAFNDFDSAQAQVQLELGGERLSNNNNNFNSKSRSQAKFNRPERDSDDAPQLLSVFSEQTLQPGQPLTLKCIASGNPIPQVIWHVYDNLPIPDHISRYRIGDYVTRDSLLVSYVNISSVLPEDGAIYTCTATNDITSVSHSARINVFGKPTIRKMPNMTAVAGESISITCPVGGYPIDVISWEREGVRLPYNHRQKVFPNGTLIVNELERVTDEGLYICIARTRDDVRSTAKTAFSLKVLVRPVIEPFKFPKSLHQSQRYNLLCTVVKGDPPVKIEWNKDGKKLNAGALPKTNIIHVTEYSVTLAFESVQPEHRGNYTCIASNAAGSSSHSASMIIHVPPRWRIEPSDSAVVKGKNAVIDCDTDAYPQSIITWSRADGSNRELPSDFKPISSNGHLRPYENGSLSIHSAHNSDSGFYMCAASNGIGPGISKVIKITVNVAAHFEAKFRTETVRRGLESRIKCSAIGDKPITISWFKDKAPFTASDDNRYDLIETIMNEGIKSELLVRNSDRRDGGLYTCLTSNSYGRDDTNIQLIVQEPPDAPTEIKIGERDGRSVRIVWSTPYSGNSPLTHYIIQHKLENDKWSIHFSNSTVLASENSLVISGLQPITTYHIRMFAVNSLGQSEPSDILITLTSEETPGGPPLHIKTMALSSTSVKISWKAPRKELQYGFIRGYYIGYRIMQLGTMDSSSQNGDFIYKTLEVKGKEAAEECTITELKRASRYEVVVQAFNSKGAGPSSESVYVKTLEFDPPTTSSLQVSEVAFNSVRLMWETQSDQIVTGYILHYKQESSDWKEIRLADVNSFVHENLRCGTRYQYYLVGFNSAGKGDPSQVVSARTDGTSPVAPDKNSLLLINSSSVTIYLDSFHDGGCKISNFEVMYKSDRSHNWTPLSRSHSTGSLLDQKQIVLNDLMAGNNYQIRITAFNQAGSTEAEYHFITPVTSFQENGPAILMGSRSTSSVPFYADILVVVPSVISFIVVVVLLSLVYIIFTRKPRHPNDIYGNYSGENKLQSEGNESVIMGDLDICHKKGLNLEHKFQSSNCQPMQNSSVNVGQFQSPYAMTSIQQQQQQQQENEDRHQLNHHMTLRGSPHKSYNIDQDGIYATVKRTPRPPRSEVHIYQYPRPSVVQADIINLDSDSFDSSAHNSIHTNSTGNNITTANSSTTPWRNASMASRFDSEMPHIKKLPESLYGHNLFQDSGHAN